MGNTGLKHIAICVFKLNLLSSNWMTVSCIRKPHIVFVMADDLGYNDVGYHGGTEIKTPCIDSLAMDGIRLENYYVQPICTPSRSQLMSGRYQIHTGLQHRVIKPMQPNALPLDNIILPEQLKNCGYSTYMVGKWHLGFYKKEFLPWKRGFDRFFGILGGSANYYTRQKRQGGVIGIDLHDSHSGPVKKYMGNYSTTLYTTKAREFITSHNKKRPMFLYFSHQAVHGPMHNPPEVAHNYSNIKNQNRRIHAFMTSSLDSSVCSVVRQLKKDRMWKNTIFIFSTDNGGQVLRSGGNNWPLRGGKGGYFEGGIKGVGFIAGKRISGRNAINRELFHISDWMPTLMQASRCSLDPKTLPLDGVNQWKVLMHNAPSQRKEILYNIDPLSRLKITPKQKKKWLKPKRGQKRGKSRKKCEKNNVNWKNGKMDPNPIFFGFDVRVTAAIRNGPWKLLTGIPGKGKWTSPPEYEDKSIPSNWEGPFELFNIKKDPYETTNVASKHPGIVKFLLKRLAKYNETSVPVSYPQRDPKASPENRKGFWAPWIA